MTRNPPSQAPARIGVRRWMAAAALMCMLPAPAAAQTPASADPWFSTRVWQAEDGLPENRVVGAAQAGDGYLWVATQVGVVRFDGVRFEPVELAGAEALMSGTMWLMLRAPGGRLWFAKEGGVMIGIEGDTVRTLGPDDGLPRNETQRSAAVDGEGALWIAYTTGTVVRFHRGKVSRFTARDGLPDGGVCWLASGADGKLWFAKNGRLGVFREGRFEVLRDLGTAAVQIAPATGGGVWVAAGPRVMRVDDTGRGFPLGGEAPATAEPTAMLEDRAGAVWVGTVSSGLFRHDSRGIARVETSHSGILSLEQDREGNLWVGTRGGGLGRIHRRVTSMINSATGLPFEGVRSVCQDASGALWLASQNGVLARQEMDGKWTTLDLEPGYDLHVNCLAADAGGSVWIGTRGGSLFRWTGGTATNLGLRERLGAKSARALLVTAAGDLWIGTDASDAVYRMRPGTLELRKFELPAGYRYLRALAEDASGAVWVGASDGLLVRISGDEVSNRTSMTGGNSIRCLHGAVNGDLWIGFSGAGTGRLRDGRFDLFGQEQGIPNGFVSQILSDGRGSIWFAGNQGIFQVRGNDFDQLLAGQVPRVSPVVYGRNEGMLGLQASFDFSPTALRSKDDRLFFSMLTGLAEVRLDNARANPVVPQVFIGRVIADGVVLPAGRAKEPGGIRLPAGVQLAQFEFTATSFVAPERVRFRYQLEDLDGTWVEAGTRRFAEYAHPPPGRFRFKVIACNNDGVWNETGDSLDVVFEAFFWETLWFKAGAVVLVSGALCGLVVFFLRRRHRRELGRLEHQRAMELERTRIARDLHDDLGVGLTEIGLLGDLAAGGSDLPESSRERLQEISGRARNLAASLDEIVWAINPANDTSRSLVDYFFPYAQKLLGSASIRCRLEVVEPLPGGSLNAEQRHEFFHAYKESLNNVIRHSGASQVEVRLAAAGRDLMIRVADNGRGLREGGGKGGHHGLAGMRERLLRLGGLCDISSSADRGTVVTFILPVQPETPP